MILPNAKLAILGTLVALLIASQCAATALSSKDGQLSERSEIVETWAERGEWEEDLLPRAGKGKPRPRPPPSGHRCKWAAWKGYGKTDFCKGGCAQLAGCFTAGWGTQGICFNCDAQGNNCLTCSARCWPYTGKCAEDKPEDEP